MIHETMVLSLARYTFCIGRRLSPLLNVLARNAFLRRQTQELAH